MIEPFKNPQLAAPTPIRIEGDVVYGHACEWARMHTAVGVKPPRESDPEYRYFHLGGYEWQGQDVDVGCITLHTTHAGLGMTGQEAIKHYEDTGSVCAYVRAGNDAHGIWYCGKLRKGITEEDIEALRGAKISGDWRGYNGRRELIGMLACNVPGYPIERERVLVAGGSLALVASGIVPLPSVRDRLRIRVARSRLAARARR